MSSYKSRRWYQRYLSMYENLIQQGVSKGSALMALRECHEMMDASNSYRRYFIAQSAKDSIKRIEFDVHNPQNKLKKKTLTKLDGEWIGGARGRG